MIVVKSSFNSEDALSLNKNAFKRFIWIYLFLSALLVVMGISALFSGRATGSAIVCFVMAVLLPVLGYLFTILLTKRNITTNKAVGNDTQQTFTFGDDGLRIEQQGAHMKCDDVFDWMMLFKVIEDKNHFFLYISNMQSLIIRKGDFIEGSPEELRGLLRQKIGVKFKSKLG